MEDTTQLLGDGQHMIIGVDSAPLGFVAHLAELATTGGGPLPHHPTVDLSWFEKKKWKHPALGGIPNCWPTSS